MTDTPAVANDISLHPTVDMQLLQLSAYRQLSETGVREAKAKADAAEAMAQQEKFKAAIWGVKFEEQTLSLEVQKDAVQRNKQLKRPCMTLGAAVRPEEEGTRFSCSWTGLIAYGETPEIACSNFDRMWVGGNDEL